MFRSWRRNSFLLSKSYSSSSSSSSSHASPPVRIKVQRLASLEKHIARHAALFRGGGGGGEGERQQQQQQQQRQLVVFTNRRDGEAPQRLAWKASPAGAEAAGRGDVALPADGVAHPMTYMTAAAFGPREHVLAGAAVSVSRLRRTPEAAIVRVPDAQ